MKKLSLFFLILWDVANLKGWLWDFYYKKVWLVNKNTSETHVIYPRCFATINMSEDNKILMSEWELVMYKKKHPYVNGCIHCNKENDTDMRKIVTENLDKE